jgi:muconolactone delta-isomerase
VVLMTPEAKEDVRLRVRTRALPPRDGELTTAELVQQVSVVRSLDVEYGREQTGDESSRIRADEAARIRLEWEAAASRRWEELVGYWNTEIVALERDTYGDGGRKILAEMQTRVWLQNEINGVRHSPLDFQIANRRAVRAQQKNAAVIARLKAQVLQDLALLREAGFAPIDRLKTNAPAAAVQTLLESSGRTR